MEVGELVAVGAQVGQDLVVELAEPSTGDDAHGHDVEQGAQSRGHGAGEDGFGGGQGLVEVEGDQPGNDVLRCCGQGVGSSGAAGVSHGCIVSHGGAGENPMRSVRVGTRGRDVPAGFGPRGRVARAQS